MVNGWLKITLEDKAIDPITLTIGIALATASISKAAHEKSVARQKEYAEEINRTAKELAAADLELAEQRKKLLQASAIQAAKRIAEQKQKEAEAKVKQKQQQQMLIAGALGVSAIGVIIYSIKK
jgi:hypothetical protein